MAQRFSVTALLPVVLLLVVSAAAAPPFLEDAANLSEGPGNITVTPEGRIVMSLHQFFSPRWLPAPITPDDAFVNDLAVDERHNAIYIADPAGGRNAVANQLHRTAVLDGGEALASAPYRVLRLRPLAPGIPGR